MQILNEGFASTCFLGGLIERFCFSLVLLLPFTLHRAGLYQMIIFLLPKVECDGEFTPSL